jgi:hypothetical protein
VKSVGDIHFSHRDCPKKKPGNVTPPGFSFVPIIAPTLRQKVALGGETSNPKRKT